MNLFIIPSWYPSHGQPLAGIFIREQAEAIAALCSRMRVIVSTWERDKAELPLRQLRRSLRSLLWRFKQTAGVRQVDSIWEVSNPVLFWSELLPFGGIHRLYSVNRRNFLRATNEFGKIDLIHAHVSYPAGYIARLLAKEYDIPYIITEHMSPFPFPAFADRFGKPIPEIVEAFRDASYTIAVSPSLASRIHLFGLGEPVVIANMVDERCFSPGTPVSNKFVFFTLCGLTDQKGIDHLLEAIALWNPSADRFEFRIGGDGPGRTSYQNMARKLGIADRVHWLGPVSRNVAPKLFRECHVYVMPSRHETFGVVYAEATASGKPVIATRCGGPEYIVNGNNGRLVEIGDVEGLAKMLEWMADHWNEFDSKVIRHDFERRFSRSSVVGQLTSLYQSAVGV